MSVQKAIDLLDQIAVWTEQARLELITPPSEPPKPAVIQSASELDRALAAAPDGTRLVLSPTFTYPSPLKLSQLNLTLESAQVVMGRMMKDAPAPRFERGIQVLGNAIHLVGLDIRNSDLTDILAIRGANVAIDRCRLLGDPAKGAKRGIAANSDGNCRITGCYIDDCFGPYPGDDTQAICAWDMLPGLLIENCYLSGGSETILIGGGDPQNELRNPRGIIIRGNTITKNPAWQSQLVGVKNTLELKNARDVVIENNDIEYTWGGHGQEGFLLVLTVRNQNGRTPTVTIQDVQIQGNRFRHAAAAMNILGRDTIIEDKPDRDVAVGQRRRSIPMARVTIAQNTFEDLNPTLYTGSKKLIQIDGGPTDLVLAENVFQSTGHTSTIYFSGGPPLERFTFINNRYPKTKYGMFGMNTSVSQAFATYVLSGTTAPNVEG